MLKKELFQRCSKRQYPCQRKKFSSDRPVSSLIESVKMYNIREVDELIFYDIIATKKNKHQIIQ